MTVAVEPLVETADGLVIRCLRNIGPYENNIFVVSDEETGEGYVLDGGFEPRHLSLDRHQKIRKAGMVHFVEQHLHPSERLVERIARA